MIIRVPAVHSAANQRYSALFWFGIHALIAFATTVGLGMAGFRLNFTPSEPLGLWRIVELDGKLRIGDLIFICPPPTDSMLEARDRGYLRRGLCAGGFAPLIKTVAAVSGQTVKVSEEVFIDGQRLSHSRVAKIDGQGRAMKPYEGGVVPLCAIYLHSAFSSSFDSRYFGPLAVKGVLGYAHEVWTYAP